ncbi:MAG: D-alanyl-D-alanine carboxypeptidase/D-alanyl-D-alanine-endopeptidase [Bacteroidetes bacterium]|nr:D-alanyl-D-alanine carboxypeptidase/D-alanyl-D-alanine-endopeptidase [Bacteroidota bacterium]
MIPAGTPSNRSVLLSLFIFVSSALSIVASVVVNRDTRSPLALGIDEIVNREENRNALWGIYVRSVDDGTVLYDHNADNLLIPASNQKLVTTASALHFLGSDYRYETPLLFVGERKADTLRGDLIIVGSGDPTFGGRDLEAGNPDPLETWARQLFADGVRHIEGRIVGDDDIFDDELFGDGWDVSLLPTNAYAAPVGGISYRNNTIRMRVEGYLPGRAPIIKAEPDGYFSITNDVSTHSRRRGRRINVVRPLGKESLSLEGAVSRRYRGTLEIPVANPTTFLLSTFISKLEESGISVKAEPIDIDDANGRPDYLRADTLGLIVSQPLSSIIERINKESNNHYAEQVFRTYGWGGSAYGGERRTRQMLDEAGIGHAGMSIRDGSGLSRKNLVSARALGDLLYYMDSQPEAELYRNSLASPGEHESTLERRLRQIDIQAKTGSLEHVRSLSGYLNGQDGQRLAFTILVNNYTTSASRTRRAIDEIVRVISRSESE